MKSLINKYPRATFMIISKLSWVVGFFYTVYIIQGVVPSHRQWILGSVYTIVTLPLNYWLTYGFTGEDKNTK